MVSRRHRHGQRPASRPLLEPLENRLALSFLPAAAYSMADWTFVLRSGDFTGDGVVDLAAVSSYSIHVLPGTADGGFDPRIDTRLRMIARGFAVGDFDFDGVLDLALACPLNGILIQLGNGDGTFREAGLLEAGARPANLDTDDFNGDGILDLAATDYSQGEDQGYLNIFLGYGDGTFAERQEYLAGRGAQHLTRGDVNGDASPDLVVTNYYSGEVLLYLNSGDGTFQKGVALTARRTSTGVALADINFDGTLDLISSNLGQNSVSILLGLGDGTFEPPVDYAAGTGPGAVAVADFNADGIPDFAVLNYHAADLTVFLGLGDGTFFREGEYPTHVRCTGLIAEDFNYDGYPDLAAVDGSDRTAYVLLNAADWSGEAPVPGAGRFDAEIVSALALGQPRKSQPALTS